VRDIYRLRLSKKESRIYATTLGGQLWTVPLKGGKKVKASIDLGLGSPLQGSSLAPSGTDLYVASTGGMIWRLDPETLDIRQSTALPARIQDIAVTPDGSALWAADENGSVLRLDPMTLAVTATITTSCCYFGGPFGLAISPDGARVYAAASQSGTLYIISEPTPNTFAVGSLYLGGDPRRIAFSEDGATAVVSNYYGGVHIIQ
jgi:DNA-binding beta-propeller fold protein YncE